MADPTPHNPTEETRRQVSTMVAFGIPQDKLAKVIGISPTTLRKYYRDEIDVADAKAQATVAKFLFTAASGEALRQGASHADCLRAAMFWMKTRGGWKETAVHEVGPAEVDKEREALTQQEMARRLAFTLIKAKHDRDGGLDPAETLTLETVSK